MNFDIFNRLRKLEEIWKKTNLSLISRFDQLMELWFGKIVMFVSSWIKGFANWGPLRRSYDITE